MKLAAMIIDCHTHVFPPEIKKDRSKYIRHCHNGRAGAAQQKRCQILEIIENRTKPQEGSARFWTEQRQKTRALIDDIFHQRRVTRLIAPEIQPFVEMV